MIPSFIWTVFIAEWSDDMLKTGMVIKIFPDTFVDSYTNWIKEEGFNCKVYRDRIVILGRTYKMVDTEEMGRILRRARLEKKFSKALMAVRIGVGEETIRSWEAGRRKPAPRNLRRYCKIVGLDMDKVIDDASIKG